MDNKQIEEVKQLIEAMMQKMSREEVMETLHQLLHLPNENFDELAEYCRVLDERETTKH